MKIKRRNFIKYLSAGALLPQNMFDWHLFSNLNDSKLKVFYKNSIVIDGLVIPRGWNQDSFKALDESGYTGFSASLPSKNFKIAMSSLLKWEKKIKSNSNKLMLAKSSNDFYSAKEQGKTGVLLGFQNATMIEN